MAELEFYDGRWSGQQIDAGIGQSQTLADDLGVVVDGNKAALGADVGQFVIVKNSIITGAADGIYMAAKAIPANAAIDATYLTAVSKGGLNAIAGRHYDTLYQADTEVQGGATLTLSADVSAYRALAIVIYYSVASGANRGIFSVATAPDNTLSYVPFAAGQHLGVMRCLVNGNTFRVNSAYILQANGSFSNATAIIISHIYGIK